LYEVKHLISRDGGNITMFLSRMEPLVQDPYDASIPGNCEWISRIVRQHSNVRRHLTPLPYLRAWQRLCRSFQESRETADEWSGKALLDQLYSPQLQVHSVGRHEKIQAVQG
jgi:hypothetical protein